jgi:hypothetical protein
MVTYDKTLVHATCMEGNSEGRGGHVAMMMLRPRPGGQYLDPDRVIRRVEAACACSACAYVETSSRGAREQALDWMHQPAFMAAAGRSAADNGYLAQREGIAEAALFVHFGVDLTSEGALLSMLLMPGHPLLIEYSPQTPRDGMRALVARCAKALNYDIVAPPATQESVAPHPQHSVLRPAAVREAGAKFVAWVVAGWTGMKSGA